MTTKTKTILIVQTVFLAFAFTWLSCNRESEKRAARITALESRVVSLQQQYQNLKEGFDQLLGIQKDMWSQETNHLAFNTLMEAQDANQQTQLDMHSVLIKDLDQRFSNLVTTLNMARQLPAKERPASGSIPPDVSARIKAKALNDWPNDYTMQDYVIRTQTADWRKVNP
jgi:hypothetical protein